VSFRWLIRDVYTELLQAIAHANLPLFRIVEVFRPERSDNHNALFQTIIQLLPRTEHDTAGPTESDGHSGGHQLQGIDLFMNFVADVDGSFNGALGFNAAINLQVDHFDLALFSGSTSTDASLLNNEFSIEHGRGVV